MATIIDALVVTLGLDSSGMKKGQKDADESLNKLKESAGKTAKDLGQQGKHAAEFYKQIRNEAMALFAVVMGGRGMQQFYDQVTNSDAAVGRLAQNLNMGVTNLQQWMNASKNLGGDAEATGQSIKGLINNIEMLRLTGQSSIVPYFRALGMTIVDTAGKMRPMDDMLLDMADRFQRMARPTAQALGHQMGLDEGTINLLIRGRKAVQEMLDEQKKIGQSDPQDAAMAQERQTAMRKLSQASEDLGRKLLTEATPAIVGILNALRDLAQWGQQHRETVAIVFGSLSAGITALSVALTAGAVAGLVALAGAAGTALAAITALSAAIGVYAVAKSMMDDNNKNIAKEHDWNRLEASLRMQNPDYSDADIDAMLDEIKQKQSAEEQKTPPTILDEIKQKRGQTGAVREETTEPRGIRNNNPGNLEYRGQTGAVREEGEGRFARFDNMTQGIAALAVQLQVYGKRGIDTVQGIIGKYAPAGENNTKSYIDAVAKTLGVSSGQHLNMGDQETLRKLIQGITSMENGAGKVSLDQINAGLAMRGGVTNSSRTETHVGTINIQTQSKDPDGIARSIGAAMERYSAAAQANYSLA